MTAVHEPRNAPGAHVRAWRAFRRWQRSRPFWGGLVTIVSALLYYASVHLNLTSFSVSFGQQGYLVWLIPLMLLLCGLLGWLAPAQRIFYGVIAVATAVYGLIAVNFGGFLIGMLVGMVGGSLIAAWSPTRPQSAIGTDQPETAAPPGIDASDDAPDDAPDAWDRVDPVTDTAELRSGPLSDELPPAMSTAPGVYPDPAPGRFPDRPVADYPDRPVGASADRPVGRFPDEPAGRSDPAIRYPTAPGGPADTDGAGARHAAEDPAPSGRRLWRRGGGAALVLLPVLIAAVAAATLPEPSPAYAAPTCLGGTPVSTKSATRPSSGAPATPTPAASAAAPDPTPSAPPSASPTGGDGGGLLGGLLGGVGKLLGGDSTPTPTPTSTPASAPPAAAARPPAANPAPSPAKSSARPTRTRSATCAPSASPSASTAPANARVLAAPAGQPPVAPAQAVLKTAKLQMSGLSYDGVFDLPVQGGGTVQALRFSMSQAVQTPFELDIPVANGKQIVQTSTRLTISGNVRFYCTRFVGSLDVLGVGLVTFTFTPDAPPPVTLSEMTFDNTTIWLAFVHADKIVAAGFGNRALA